MAIQAPNADHVREIAASFGIALSEADAASFAGLLKGVAASYDRLDAMVEPKPEVKYARTTGARPRPRTTATTPGPGNRPSRARRAACWRARRSR